MIAMKDKYGEGDFSVVPSGPYRGRPWSDVPALTLHNILNAIDFGLMPLDERRVMAIREGLSSKDRGQESVGSDQLSVISKQ